MSKWECLKEWFRSKGAQLKAWLKRPTTKAAIVIAALAAATMLWWRAADADWIDAWMPNIVTGLLAVAATITFVEWIVRREKTEREAERAAAAYGRLELALVMLMNDVATDYSATHRHNAAVFRFNPVEVIQHWLEDKGDTRRDLDDESELHVLTATLRFADAVKRVVDTEHQILPTNLVAAMNQIVERAARVREGDETIGYKGLERQIWEAHQVLYYVRFLAEMLRSMRPDAWAQTYGDSG